MDTQKPQTTEMNENAQGETGGRKLYPLTWEIIEEGEEVMIARMEELMEQMEKEKEKNKDK